MSVEVLSSRSPLRFAVIDAAQRVSTDMYALVVLLAEFDRCGEWAFDGAASCAHWVAERVDVEVCTVREWLRIGHALSDAGLGPILATINCNYRQPLNYPDTVHIGTRVTKIGNSSLTIAHASSG